MANLYYNAAVDTQWDTLGNWWNDSVFTDPAVALPATGDTVYLAAQMEYGPSVSVTLNHIYVVGASTGGGSFGVNFTGARGNATLSDYSTCECDIIGNATFNGHSGMRYIVRGEATFNDFSWVARAAYDPPYAGVLGNATFNDYSQCAYDGYIAVINGNVIFNDNAVSNIRYYGGGIYGNVTYTRSSFVDYDALECGFEVSGTVRFTSTTPVSFTINDLAYDWIDASAWIFETSGAMWTFNGTASLGGEYATGKVINATFNDSSYNGGTVTGDATFNDFSTCGTAFDQTTVIGAAYFNDYSVNSAGTIDGDATFNDNSYSSIRMLGGQILGNATYTASSFTGGTVGYGVVGSVRFTSITPVSFIINSGDYSWIADSSGWIFDTTNPSWTFNGTSTLGEELYVGKVGNATFNNSSQITSVGTVTANATFNNSSYNGGTVSGNATFRNSSRNYGTVEGNATVYSDGGSGKRPIGGTVNGTVTYIGFNTLYYKNTTGDQLWKTLANWSYGLSDNNDNPTEIPWTGPETSSVNLRLAPNTLVPQLNGLLLGTNDVILATCDNKIAQEIIDNGFNILEPLVYHN